jgi:hypothetical protein
MTYQLLAKAVAEAGFFTTGDFESKVICASKTRPEGGYTGNSFWIARRDSGWFLGTWGPHVYRIPEPARVSELCVTWLRRHPDGTAADVDSYIREKFELVEIDPEELPSI